MLESCHSTGGVAVLIGLIVAFGCAPPAEVESLLPTVASELVEAEFPGAGVGITEVTRTGGRARAVAGAFDLGGSGVVFIFTHDAEWKLTEMEWEGSTYSIDDVHGYANTLQGMERLDDALSTYRSESGSYPEGDGSEALEALLPRHVRTAADLQDGWGTPYGYSLQQGEYRLASAGLDREFGSVDDIIIVSTDRQKRESDGS